VFIGILPSFQDSSVAEGVRANFEVVALNGQGKRISLSGLQYSWVREDVSYQWYQADGSWKYQSVMRDRLITGGTMNVGASGVVRLGQAMPYGSYRLTIIDEKSGAQSSYRFYSGWSASASGDRPDRIPVAADKPAYKPGEVAHVQIKPSTDGQALVVVAGDRVFSSQLIDAPASGASVDVKVDANWGPGAYVLVTDYHPLKGSTGREPVRAIGLTWLGVDNSDRTLTVSIGGPQKITPRQHIIVPVTVKGIEAGDSAYLTLAAVDEGILQLTDFVSPDPVKYYFGKRQLGVGMRDDYGRLIKPEKGAIGSLREGGDNIGGRSLSVVPIKTVALFSGLVKIGPDGTAQVPLDIPDFNGELRLMAVAWTPKKLGDAARPMTVRDPVVADIVLPRFLAPGDKSQAALNLDNVEGKPGSYVAVIRAGGPVAMDGNQPQTVITQQLRVGQRTLQTVGLNGARLGVANISLTVTGPGGFKVSRSWPIEVRSPQLDVARETIEPLDAGQTYVADHALVADLVPSTAGMALNVSAAHGFSDVAGLLRWLDRYPYGCVEQTTSRAMPLLYFNDLADLVKFKKDEALRPRIQDAIDNVLDMQNFAGNFGMWSAGSDADPWLSVFALDFLYQAKAKNFVVPNEALRRGAGWLQGAASSDSNDDNTRAYAFYVLARAGQANVSDLRYFADTKANAAKTAIAAALTGAAAADVGDRSRAAAAFAHARDVLRNANVITYPDDDYGSLLRDIAGSVALASEAGQNDLIPAFLAKSTEVNMTLNATTTQEKAWMLRAAYELSRQK
ncbi:MAG TPA: alpha-2-macroglobulin family protein, partial [Rhizomicrobium sp.]|nr:alpha-2-macroglobulin family protein [Rhizomicrobium sp.]